MANELSAGLEELATAIVTPTKLDVPEYVLTVDVRKTGVDLLAANIKVWRRPKTTTKIVGDIGLVWCATAGCLGLFDRTSSEFTEDEIYEVERCRNLGQELPAEISAKMKRYSADTFVCRKCGSIRPRSELGPDNYYVKNSTDLADKVACIWQLLQARADIHVRFYKEDFLTAYKSMSEGTFTSQARKLSAIKSVLEAGRSSRENAYYELKAILADISAGKALSSTLKVLLRGA